MKQTYKNIFGFVLFLSLAWNAFSQNARYVNPFIGSSNFGTTNPGAIVPQGMASVVPFNVSGMNEYNKFDKDSRWWSTPYSSENTFLTGFSHVNLSGVGCPELGVILLMPTLGEINANPAEYGSVMSKQEAKPGYYSCFLDKYNIWAEATATQRTGVSRYAFPKGKANILLNLGLGLTNEKGARVRIVNNREVEGSRMTGTFCYTDGSERPVYFVVRFSKAADEFGVWKKMPPMQAEAEWSKTADKYKYYKNFQSEIFGDEIGAYFSFTTEKEEKIVAEVGISYVSIANARENLEAESSHFDFEKVRQTAWETWNKTLSVVNVEGGGDDDKTIFYTALYHMHIHPNILNDVNGQYPEMEGFGTGKVTQGNRYTIFSLWDTYRNYHPLMSLLYPNLQRDFVESMVGMYKESGWLPKWELNGKETYTMDGDPAGIVIADTYLRGIKNFDVQTAYEAMLKQAETSQTQNKIRKNNDFYWENGYVPFSKEYDNSVSEALELYVSDWSLAQLAKVLGEQKTYKKFLCQSQQWTKYFDEKEFKMLRPKDKNGNFFEKFNPKEGENFEPVNGFHEGTAWQYAFCPPHDMKRMVKYYGGRRAFVKKLQKVFDEGLFDMANEPDIHYPFLFNYARGEEWRAQKTVQNLIKKYFKNAPDGLPGNDDCGTMSAWLVYSMMGIYPVSPANMEYAITTPVFDKVEIALDSNFYKGKKFIIEKENKGTRIKKLILNGKSLKSYFIDNKEITGGGELKVLVK